MQSLSHADLADPTTPLPSGSNNCYLNARSCDVTNGISVRWSIPGFEQYALNEQGIRVYRTQALTYYVDLNSLLTSNDVRSINPAAINYLENYIHRTLIKICHRHLLPLGLLKSGQLAKKPAKTEAATTIDRPSCTVLGGRLLARMAPQTL
jgi:hypothetical protein